MISAISSVSESYRLSHNFTHQSLVVALQSEAIGLKINVTGVRLEISQAALKAAGLAKEEVEQKKVQPTNPTFPINAEYPLNR